MICGLRNGWTGGQYSVFRVAFGLYLAVHFGYLVPYAAELFSSGGLLPDGDVSPFLNLFPNVLAVYDAPWFATALTALGVPAALAFAIGYRDRTAAVLLWYLLACQFGRNPLISNPGLPYVGLLLLVHATLVPPAPFGSVSARRRIDPSGGWRLPGSAFAVVWFLMAAGYSYSGYTKLISPSWRDGSALARVLDNPLARPTLMRDLLLDLPAPLLKVATWGGLALELLFLPLAWLARARPWIWTMMLAMHVGLIVLIDFADLSLGMVVLHLFTFDPGWIRPKPVPEGGESHDLLFYDGSCTLCHGAVRFLLAEDVRGSFRFAPLESQAFADAVPDAERRKLPDSIIVLPAGQSQGTARELLDRSGGAAYLLERLGGGWRLLGAALRFIPRPLRDAGYDLVARYRKRWFGTKSDACPILPPELRARFVP